MKNKNKKEILSTIVLSESELKYCENQWLQSMPKFKKFFLKYLNQFLLLIAFIPIPAGIALTFLADSLVPFLIAAPAAVIAFTVRALSKDQYMIRTAKFQKKKIFEKLEKFDIYDIHYLVERDWKELTVFERFYLRDFLKHKGFKEEILIHNEEELLTPPNFNIMSNKS